MFLPACILLGAIVALTTLPFFPASLVLTVQNRAVYEKVVDGTLCEVDFTHSVNKGRIREVYRINPAARRLTLEKGYFQSYGAGMLDTLEDTDGMNFRQEGDFFVLDFKPDWQKSIRYIGGNIARHVFVYGEDRVDVGELYPRKAFSVSVSRRSLLQKLLKLGA